MIPLILSILSSTIIFIIFRMFKRFEVDTFQAIVFNYFTAAGIGFTLYGHTWNPEAWVQNSWMIYSLITSFLFISLFFLMGLSSQNNGVASTSIAVKMSMAISLTLFVFYYKESPSLLKITGILLAFISVILVSLPNKKNRSISNHKWMLIVLFFGGGALDFVLNYVQESQLNVLEPSLFSAISFGLAGCIGVLILSFKLMKGSSKLAIKNIIGGITLGIPNFFSIYFLLLAYTTTGWTDTTVLALTNVSVVIGTVIIGLIIFKESKTSKKMIGLAIALLAIITLYIAEQ